MKKSARVLVAASLMMTFLGFGCNSTQAEPVDGKETAPVVANNGGEVENSEEGWEEVEQKWNEMDKVKVSNFEEVSEEVKKQKEEMLDLFSPLIEKEEMSAVTAEAITAVYGENLRGSLESTVELPCCYEPMMVEEWDCSGIDTRDGLEKKLALIEELIEKGGSEKEALEASKKGIENRLDLLFAADKYWDEKGEGPCEEHPAEVDVLLHLYDINAGGIKEAKDVGPDLIKASECIVMLEKE